jgi:hypothetical protein
MGSKEACWHEIFNRKLNPETKIPWPEIPTEAITITSHRIRLITEVTYFLIVQQDKRKKMLCAE